MTFFCFLLFLMVRSEEITCVAEGVSDPDQEPVPSPSSPLSSDGWLCDYVHLCLYLWEDQCQFYTRKVKPR